MRTIFYLVFITLFFLSCKRNEKPKVIYPESNTTETTELEKDPTINEISDLPIHIDSTQYLIHPLGEYKIYNSRSKYSFGSSSYSSGTFNVTGYRQSEISGNMHNIKFQQINSNNLIPITSKNIRIKSITFLRPIFNSTKKQLLIYKVIDKDTNRDNKLDEDDVKSLYISNIDGTDFKKLTSEFYELIDWNIIDIKNRLYFRSIEDSNKNGEFDKNDKIHYQYIDFTTNKLEVINYNPTN